MSVTEEVFARWDSEDTHVFGFGRGSSGDVYRKIDREKKADKKNLNKMDAEWKKKTSELRNEITRHLTEYRAARNKLITAYGELANAVKQLGEFSGREAVYQDAQHTLTQQKDAVEHLEKLSNSEVSSMNNKPKTSGSGN